MLVYRLLQSLSQALPEPAKDFITSEEREIKKNAENRAENLIIVRFIPIFFLPLILFFLILSDIFFLSMLIPTIVSPLIKSERVFDIVIISNTRSDVNTFSKFCSISGDGS